MRASRVFSAIAFVVACGGSSGMPVDGPPPDQRSDGNRVDAPGGSAGWIAVAGVTAPVGITISPNTLETPYTIYVGTAGGGVFFSTDAATWTNAGSAGPA